MRFQRLFTALAQCAAVFLCLVGGAGVINALLLHPAVSDRSVAIVSFIDRKRVQPVVHTGNRWTLLAAGDVMLSRYVRAVLEREGIGYPYTDITGIARQADIAFANLENPVGRGTPMPFSGLVFRAEPEWLQGLKEAGFDVLSIANNHQSDNGREGIGQTIAYLRDAGFAFAGAGSTEQEARTPAMLEAGGQTVAFLAYGDSRFRQQVHFALPDAPGIALADPAVMKEDVERARREGANVVVVSLHAGEEYRNTPDRMQRALLEAAADAGADVVLGHHPHVIQPLELREESWIIGSLGNLVFDQMWSEAVRRGMMLQFRFEGESVREIEAIPVQIHGFAQARIAQGIPRDLALESLEHPVKDATVIRWAGAQSGGTVTPRAMPLQADPLPGFSVEKTLRDNLNDNRRGEEYRLKGGVLLVEEDGFPLWESPANWWVQDAFTADIDGNRRRELVLSLWKSGGNPRDAVRNHLFIYGFEGGQLQPLWQSEALEQPLCELAIADLDADGRDEIVTLEGTYSDDASCGASAVAVWTWNEGAFTNEWRSTPGRYWDIRTEGAGSGEQIVVNGTAE